MSASLDSILDQLLTEQDPDRRWNDWLSLSAVETFLLLSKTLKRLEEQPAAGSQEAETLIPVFLSASEESPYRGVMENLTPRILACYQRDGSDHGRQMLNRLRNGFAWSLT